MMADRVATPQAYYSSKYNKSTLLAPTTAAAGANMVFVLPFFHLELDPPSFSLNCLILSSSYLDRKDRVVWVDDDSILLVP